MAKKSPSTRKSPASLCKLLGDEKRYEACKIFLKRKKPVVVGDIALALDMNPSAASHLLGKLHRAKVVTYKRDGREMRYSFAATPEARRIERIIRAT